MMLIGVSAVPADPGVGGTLQRFGYHTGVEIGGEYDGRLVLPVGIEPTTSPLPRGCSTTELRQPPDREIGRAATEGNTPGSRQLARQTG